MKLAWITPDRPLGQTQDELARAGLGRNHSLNVWGWTGRPAHQNASRLLGLASDRALAPRWTVNQSDLIVYDYRFCSRDHWLTEVASLYAGLLCVTSEQVSGLCPRLVENSLGLAVEGPVAPWQAESEPPKFRLNWPFPDRPGRRIAPGDRRRIVFLCPTHWDHQRLEEFLDQLPPSICQYRVLYTSLEGARPRYLRDHICLVPRSFFEKELSFADLVINLGEPGSAEAYFDQLESLAARCATLTRSSGWLADGPEAWKVPENAQGVDWDALIERLEHLLACPWELEALVQQTRDYLLEQHQLDPFVLRLARFAKEAPQRHLRRARVVLSHQARRLEETVGSSSAQQLIDGLLAPRANPSPTAGPRRPPSIAYLSPLPPERSGVAVYSAHLLPELSAYGPLHLFSRGALMPRELVGQARLSLRPYQNFPGHDERDAFDQVVYHLGNDSRYHREITRYALRRPGFVVLHDTHLGAMMRQMLPVQAEYEQQLRYELGPVGNKQIEEVYAGVRSPLSLLPTMFNRRIVESATGVIVHSQWDRDQVLASSPDSAHKIFVVPLCTPRVNRVSRSQRQAARERLGIPEDAFLIGSFGFVEANKKVESIVENLREFLKRRPKSLLVLVGKLPDVAYGREIEKLIADSGVSKQIRVTGYLRHADYQRYLHSCDLSIQFRRNFRGGGALSVNQSLAYGLPTLITSEGPFLEYPQDVVMHVPPDQEASLSDRIEDCYLHPERTRALGEKAWEFSRDRFSPERCAAAYAKILGLV